MGSLIGHVLPGVAFLVLGLWHLFNQIMLYTLRPNSYISSPWFPTSKIRYLELFFIIVGSSISISMELFIGPQKHHPFDVDGTIPSNHLRNFEHSSISMFFLVYASLAILLDKKKPKSYVGLTQLLGAMAFGQQYFMFYLHSTDHKGLEGQYHYILQIIIIVCLITTLMGIGYPRNFLIGFVRSTSIVFQGVWFMLMGYMLWTPEFIPKGCLIHNDDGHIIVKCENHESLHRAKSLVNIIFSWLLIGISIFAISLYLGLVEMYGKRVQYSSLPKGYEEVEEESNEVESNDDQKKFGDTKGNMIHVGKGLASFDLERFKV